MYFPFVILDGEFLRLPMSITFVTHNVCSVSSVLCSHLLRLINCWCSHSHQKLNEIGPRRRNSTVFCVDLP